MAFADKYGTLSELEKDVILAPEYEEALQVAGIAFQRISAIEGLLCKGQRLKDWKGEILEMRDAVFLWDIVRRQDTAELQKHVLLAYR